jgi:hypothetical protein
MEKHNGSLNMSSDPSRVSSEPSRGVSLDAALRPGDGA